MRIQISEAAPRVMNYFLARSQGIPADMAIYAMTDYTGTPAQASPLIETLRTHHRLQTHEGAECRIASARIESPACLHYGTTVNIAALLSDGCLRKFSRCAGSAARRPNQLPESMVDIRPLR